MTNVTAATVNARVDKMARMFLELEDCVNEINVVFKQQDEILEQDARVLLAQMDELRRSIQASPAIRRQADIELADLKDKMLPVKDRLDDVEADTMLGIDSKLGANGKPKYGNDKARAAALRIALVRHEEYQEKTFEYRALDLNRVRLRAQVDEIERKDKNDRVIYGGCVARLEDLTKRRM